MIRPLLYERMSDLAYVSLRELILYAQLKPDTPLSIREIATQFGVSPTPVRDAFQRLQVEGLIVNSRGTYAVRALRPKEISDLFAVREALEQFALRAVLALLHEDPQVLDLYQQSESLLNALSERGHSAAEVRQTFDSLDEALHFTLLVESAHNEALTQCYLTVHALLTLARHLNSELVTGLTGHLAILEAIRRGDSDAAHNALSNHLRSSLDEILSSSRELTGYEGGDTKAR